MAKPDSSLSSAEDITDTLAMANIARSSQGHFEMEVTVDDEADLHRHYKDCMKNPGHDQFVPVNEFCLKHLPAQYQDPDIVDMVRAHSDLTVLLRVKCISDERPDIHPSSGEPYPFIKYRGSKKIGRTGTGFISAVYRYPSTTFSDSTLCQCSICTTTGQRQKTWGTVMVETATHVIFDQQECDYTKCQLFYDASDAKLADLVTLENMICIESDVNTDKATLKYETHDMELIERLYKMRHHYNKLFRRLYHKYRSNPRRPLPASPDDDSYNPDNDSPDPDNDSSDPGDDSSDPDDDSPDTDNKHRLIVIASHPHGCSKMVTVGVWTDMEEHNFRDTQYFYTTQTCPGSSGARIYMLGTRAIWHLHRGSCKTPGFNCSGISTNFPLRSVTMSVPASKAHLFIGKERKKLKKIQKRVNVNMHVMQEIWAFQDSDVAKIPASSLYICGLPHNFRRAKQMVEELLAETDDSISEQIKIDEVVIPGSKVNHILEDAGKNVRSLKKMVRMYMLGDKYEYIPTDVDGKLYIYGFPHNIQHAKREIEEFLAQKDDSLAEPSWRPIELDRDTLSDIEDTSDEEDGDGNGKEIEKEQMAGKGVKRKATHVVERREQMMTVDPEKPGRNTASTKIVVKEVKDT